MFKIQNQNQTDNHDLKKNVVINNNYILGNIGLFQNF